MTMVVLEWILYGVCVVIAYIVFRYNWWFFPKKLSRWKRNRMSEYDFVYNRVLTAVCAGVVSGGFCAYIVYALFHMEPSVPSPVEVKLEKTEIEETQGSETLPEVTRIVRQWDEAHNERNYALFDTLYMDYVGYYGKEMSKQQCVTDKKRLFQTYPDFSQQSKHIRFEKKEEGLVKVYFGKQVHYAGKSRAFPSYLLLNRAMGDWKIEMESDEVTDAHLKETSK
ncbi:MAG TPA: hypothetical protein H9814_02760 [Candidatus Bacteroides merdigallinarum]|uniref:Uncharacterized protein n=1 Tax=Candidatus Bacteroides merdigallinarum TaxID=2838473 RepID=A0A9D2E777_9BACE|nr:hypothetical protein [Candidatus Bacteroides merdigallinarum]